MRRIAIVIALAGCGRIDFDVRGGALAWVGTFVAHDATSTAIDTFTAQARRAGDAILLHVECDLVTPTAVSVTAPGWTIAPIGPLTGMGAMRWTASFGAIAPDDAPATFTVTWTGPHCVDLDEIGDELAGASPAAPFGAHVEKFGTGDCTDTITTTSDGEAIWAACSAGGTLTGITGGYTKAADDGHDDWTAYRLTGDPAGTAETVAFTNTMASASYVMTMVTIRPQGALP